MRKEGIQTRKRKSKKSKSPKKDDSNDEQMTTSKLENFDNKIDVVYLRNPNKELLLKTTT